MAESSYMVLDSDVLCKECEGNVSVELFIFSASIAEVDPDMY